MARKLAVGVNWQGKPDFKGTIEKAKIADAAGIHSIWVAEAWGRDAFTLLTLLAEHTSKIQLATSIVNIYSRTPAALAQHFGTLDELSNGRMIIGLGTSGPQVIEHFHGVPFNPPLTRMKEYVEIINMIFAQTPLNYEGKLFKLQRGFTMRFETPRKHIPIWIASLNKKSVEFTAKKTDGWLPVMIPINSLKKAIADFREIAICRRAQPARRRSESARTRDGYRQRRSREGGTRGQRRVLRRAHGDFLFGATHALRLRRRRAKGQAGVGCGRLEGRHRGAVAQAAGRVGLYRRYRRRGRAAEGAGRGGRRSASD